jgi:hypothetical protein
VLHMHMHMHGHSIHGRISLPGVVQPRLSWGGGAVASGS